MSFVSFKTENIANHYNLLCYFYLFSATLDYSTVVEDYSTEGEDIISHFYDNVVSHF